MGTLTILVTVSVTIFVKYELALVVVELAVGALHLRAQDADPGEARGREPGPLEDFAYLCLIMLGMVGSNIIQLDVDTGIVGPIIGYGWSQ